ncbi:MAG: primase [Gemmatimonadetes bacterium]|nr:primase [Gemmatimonadota bacterium]
MIPDETVERVRESADIVGVIGEYVDLKRQGSDFRGPCPFHQGTGRNFSVSPKKMMYHCFVCGEKGNVFTYLMKRLGVDFPTAVKMVGEKSGIEVIETKSGRADEKDTREPLWEVNGAAVEYFRQTLWEDDLGLNARKYLEEREISRELAEKVGIGFAPREIGLMRAYLNTLGFDDERLIESGLLHLPEGSTEPRPRFRDRLIFPIYDVSGRVVGFGGRLLGPGEPKYLNSAESPVFSKGKLLYGLNWAKQAARRDERMLVVEGYFDAVRLIGAGIESVVAPMGTALTEDQAKLIRRYTDHVYLLYDSDKAGLKATFRSGDELLAQGAAVQVVTLPDGEDPDTYVRTHGARGLESQITSSIDVFERKIQLLERGGWFADLRKKRQALDRLLPTLRATSDSLTRDMYLGHAAHAAGVTRELLERELSAPPRSRTGRTTARSPAPPDQQFPPPEDHGYRDQRPERPLVRQGDRRRVAGERASSAERELIRVLLHRRGYFEQVIERAGEESFRDDDMRRIFAAMALHGADAGPDVLAEHLDGDAVVVMQSLLEETGGLDHADEAVAGSLSAMHERSLTDRMAEIDREMPIASEAQKDELTAEKMKLTEELRRLGGRWWKKFR